MSEATSQVARANHPWKTAVLAGMASYLDAGALSTTGVAVGALYAPALGLTAGSIGALLGLQTLMFAVGALFGGRLGDRFGRRRVFTPRWSSTQSACGAARRRRRTCAAVRGRDRRRLRDRRRPAGLAGADQRGGAGGEARAGWSRSRRSSGWSGSWRSSRCRQWWRRWARSVGASCSGSCWWCR